MSKEDHSLELEYDFTECLAVLEFESIDGKPNSELPLYSKEELLIGRDPKCNFSISDQRVSKQHFRIYSIIYSYSSDEPAPFPPLIYCEDLESTNGTYVNGALIGRITHERVGHLLCDGDAIEILPSWRFRFHQSNHQKIERSKNIWEDLKYFEDRFSVSKRMLGNGNYGEVYLATEVATTKQVVCKIVDLNKAMQKLSEHPYAIGEAWEAGLRRASEEKKRVLREIRILARLSHPNIINLKKAFLSHHALYLFTELASGGDLYSYLQANGGRLNDHHCRFIIRQVTLAVQFLHSKCIAHRDIKLENVLVTGTHYGGRAILTDFGFAVRENLRTGRMLSKLGTADYVAPEVEAVEQSNKGYTKSADLWSLGILTACMFTGDTIIPRQEFTDLSQVDIAARYLGVDDSYARECWSQIPPRALRFIRGLIYINPEERMTADDALSHSWFTKPIREADALNEAIQRVNHFWKQRDSEAVVLEALPGVVLPAISGTPDSSVSRFRRKIPDASLSPYFGLDRHLQQKGISTRKRLLDDLSQSGSRFLTTKEPRKKKPFTNGSRTARDGSIVSVDGTDIFAMALNPKRELEPIMEEVSLVPTTPIPRTEKNYGFSLSDPLHPLISSAVKSDVPKTKRSRTDSEDRRVHDAAAKKLPMYSTAKALKETVNKMRGFYY